MPDRTWSNSARCASVKNSWFAYLAGRCRGVSNSSVQMPCRSGSPQEVFSAGAVAEAAGAWADVPVMDADMAAPTAAATIATVIVEPEKRSSMIISFRLAWCYFSRFCSKAHYLSRRSPHWRWRRACSQREHMQHDCIALLSEFRCIDKPRSGCRARSRDDRDILLAIDFERHRRRGKARTDVDLPQFVERGVIERRNGTVEQREKHEPAAGRERAAEIRVDQVHALFDLAGQRVGGLEVAFPPFGGGRKAAVPASLLVVLFAVDRNRRAVRQSRDVDDPGFRAVGRRPVVVAA